MLSLMKDLELKVTRLVKMMQDNLSAIRIIDNGDIIFVHCPGEMIPADMLTKPLEGTRLKTLSQLINLHD